MRYKLLPFLVFLVSLGGCESEIDLDVDRLGLNYFPLEVGQYRIYNVIETNYTVLEVKMESYQLKEIVVDSGLNASSNLSYVVHRLTRLNDTQEWHKDSVWTAQVNTSMAILTENNVPLVKLSFPIKEGISWDGNRLNSLTNDTYYYTINLPDSVIGENNYQKLVKVIQHDFVEDFLGLEYRYETYAPNIGMVFKENIVLNYCQQDCPKDKDVEAGRSIIMTISSYGKE